MKIALDYDGTFTRNPDFWIFFIGNCKAWGFDLKIVTMRKPEEAIKFDLHRHYWPEIIYTSRMQKREYCDQIGWQPDIWIDDSPEFIVRKDVLEFLAKFGAANEEGRGQTEG